MSICKACNGKGMVDDPMWADEAHTMQYLVARLKKCPACNGTGQIEQTNEEWLNTLDTWDKGMALSKVAEELGSEASSPYFWADWLKAVHEE